MNESVYKVVDSRGRVHLPKEFRGKMDLDCGEIVKLTAGEGGLQVKKVHLIELGTNPQRRWRPLSMRRPQL